MQPDPRLNEIDDCLYRLALRAFIFHEGKVLLVREKDIKWWSFPGGGIDYGENIFQALPRELAEELGVTTADIKTDFQIVHVSTGSVVNRVPRANLFCRVEVPADRIRAGKDVLEFDWFTPAEVTADITSRYVGPSTDDAKQFITTIEALAAVPRQEIL